MDQINKRFQATRSSGGLGAWANQPVFPLFPFSLPGGKERVRLSSCLLSYTFIDATTAAAQPFPVFFFCVNRARVFKTLFEGYTDPLYGLRNPGTGGYVAVADYEPQCQAFDATYVYNNEFQDHSGGVPPATGAFLIRLAKMNPFFSVPLAAIGYGNGRHVNIPEIYVKPEGDSDAIMMAVGAGLSIGEYYQLTTYPFTVHGEFSCVVDYV